MNLKSNYNIGIITALACSAASALIYEVVATNVLFFYFIKSSYSIATVLSVFLFGLGLGSFIIYKILHKTENKKLLFGIFQIVIALYAFFVLSNLLSITSQLSSWNIIIASFIILLLPTIFLGAAFPLAAAIFKKQKRDIVGLVYSSDLIGAIAGTLLAGFIFIPWWGHKVAILFAVGFNLLSAMIILPKTKKIIPLIIIILLVGLSLTILPLTNKTSAQPLNSTLTTNTNSEEYQFYADSPYGIISVSNNNLFIDKRSQCSFLFSDPTAELDAYITETKLTEYALDPLTNGNLKILNIGLGCGGTLYQAVQQEGVQADVVEINPVVVEANQQFSDILKNPQVNLIINDGLSYLRTTTTNYNSVLVDVENPEVAHASNLYTVEAFEIINNRLDENGTFALWNYETSHPDFNHYLDILYYSLKEAFPYVYQYRGAFLATKQNIGQKEYQPTTPYKINTINHNTLTPAYLENK